ncbi:MAG: shikimate kinase [Pseudomonadota bacterium]
MPHSENLTEKLATGNLTLVGMMGSGKSTMGRILAKHLDKSFFDSDIEIQARTGVSIPHIFDVEGEAGFRQREAAEIATILQRQQTVLATGGGAVLLEQNRHLMQAQGIVIYLQANVHDLWQRTRHDKNRPLLQTADPLAKLNELFVQRDPLYLGVADIVVQTGRQSVQSLMLHLVEKIHAFQSEESRSSL